MAKIPGLNDTLLGNSTLGFDWVPSDENDFQPNPEELVPNALGNSTVMYKMMHYAIDTLVSGGSDIELENFAPVYFSQQPGAITPIPRGENDYFVPVVCVYEVLYD